MDKKIELYPTTKALIFDLDGTLANSMPIHFAAWEETLKKYNINFDPKFLLSCAGMPCYKIVGVMNNKYGTNINPDEFMQLKEQFVIENLHKVEPIKAVVDLVYQYHQKMPMAVGTGGQKQIALKTLQLLDLEKYFSVVVTANDVEKHKPNPDTFLRCAQLMGITPENCQVFEDAVLGFEAAKNAGMEFTDVKDYY